MYTQDVRSMEEQVEAKLASLAKLVSGIEYGSIDATSIQTGASTDTEAKNHSISTVVSVEARGSLLT